MRIGRWARRAGIAAGVCSAGVAVAWLVTVPLTVKRVDVRGARLVPAAEVERMAGVRPGTPIGPAKAGQIEADLKRHPGFRRVSVTRGLTGTLHVRVSEREPAAWLRGYRCAVAADGVLLPHVRQRDPSWISLDGIAVRDGRVEKPAVIGEALSGRSLGKEVDVSGGGVWRRLPTGVWEWETGGKRIHMTSPIRTEEFKRLVRFRRAYPREWSRARLLDLRFADRVVVKR